MKKIIYESKEELLKEVEYKDELKHSSLPKTGEELLKYFKENTRTEPIKERIEKKESFIQKVIQITTELGLTVKIVESETGINATIPLYILGMDRYSKRMFEVLIHIADAITFVSKDNIPQMMLTYHTHETYLDNKPMFHIKQEKDATQ